MDLARLVRYKTQRWRCTYPHERSQREREAETLRDARAARFSISLSFSLSSTVRDSVAVSTGTSRVAVVGARGAVPTRSWASFRLGTTFTRRRNFHATQRGIRDEFNSDWSLSITSSLSGTFSLPPLSQRHSLRFVSLLVVAIAYNVLSFLLYFPLPLLIRFFSYLYCSHPSLFSISSLPFLSCRDEKFFPLPTSHRLIYSHVSNVTRTASEYEFNLAVRR